MRQAFVRHVRALAITAIAVTGLAACSHSATLTPLDGGPPGLGDVSFRGGAMKIYVDGKAYSGPFISPDDPEVARLSADPLTVTGPVTAGRYWGVQGKDGPMGAVLAAEDGASIACRFTYERKSNLGGGLCRGDDGRNFSLRMR